MSVQELLVDLESRDIVLAVSRGNLKVSAPPFLLTDSIKDQIRQHKQSIICLLEEKTIRTWLDQIGETNPLEITKTLQLCGEKPRARDYYLRRANGKAE